MSEPEFEPSPLSQFVGRGEDGYERALDSRDARIAELERDLVVMLDGFDARWNIMSGWREPLPREEWGQAIEAVCAANRLRSTIKEKQEAAQ